MSAIADLASKLGRPVPAEPVLRVVPDTPPVRKDRSHVKTERPTDASDFIGQTYLMAELDSMLTATAARGEAADHCLFVGPAGLGKTSTARVVAARLGKQLHVSSGTVLKKNADIAKLLGSEKVESGDAVFIDEIHAMGKEAMVSLLTAIEDFEIVVKGTGRNPDQLIELEPFVLIAGTTDPGVLSRPLLDRFGFMGEFEWYSVKELTTLVARYARKVGAELDPAGAARLARAGRGVPRTATNLFRRVRNHAQNLAGKNAPITDDLVKAGLEIARIDSLGLDAQEQLILRTIAVDYAGGPVGLARISQRLNLPPKTVAAMKEPYMIRIGLIAAGGSGRVATPAAYRHLGLKVPPYLPVLTD